MRWWAGVLACCAHALGCDAGPAPPSPPVQPVDPARLCEERQPGCLNTGAQTHDLDGLTVVHKRVPGDPVVAVQLLFDHRGRGNDPVHMWSETLALMQLSVAGPDGMGIAEWDRLRAALGARVGAADGADFSRVWGAVPRVHWERFWTLWTDALAAPTNQDWLLDNRRRVLQLGFERELDEPQGAAQVVAWAQLFSDHRYNLERETPARLDDVDTGRVQTAWEQLMVRERTTLVVVGDVAWSELQQRLEDLRWHPATKEDPPPGSEDAAWEPPRDSWASVLDYPEAPTWHVQGYFVGPRVDSADYAPLVLGLRVLDQRLFRQVRDEAGLAYTVGVGLGFARQPYGSLWLSTVEPERALERVRETVQQILEQPIADDELEAGRQLVATGLLGGSRTTRELSYLLGRWQLTTGDRRDADAFLEGLADIDAAQVRSALGRYLRNAAIAAAGSGGELDAASLEQLLPSGVPDVASQ